ncbi:MAG: Double zinc ribbon [Betaproteobacteria bacterium]|nr:Double zinc ribbon [Betaproteobacteria bacterium]
MNCKACGADAPHDTRFCTSCGNNLTAAISAKRACHACASELNNGAQFCTRCGTRSCRVRMALPSLTWRASESEGGESAGLQAQWHSWLSRGQAPTSLCPPSNAFRKRRLSRARRSRGSQPLRAPRRPHSRVCRDRTLLTPPSPRLKQPKRCRKSENKWQRLAWLSNRQIRKSDLSSKIRKPAMGAQTKRAGTARVLSLAPLPATSSQPRSAATLRDSRRRSQSSRRSNPLAAIVRVHASLTMKVLRCFGMHITRRLRPFSRRRMSPTRATPRFARTWGTR